MQQIPRKLAPVEISDLLKEFCDILYTPAFGLNSPELRQYYLTNVEKHPDIQAYFDSVLHVKLAAQELRYLKTG